MIRGLYSAASALDAATQNQEMVADNLAHCTTPGFRRHSLMFESLQGAAAADGGAFGVGRAAPYTSFEPGPVQQTGNPLDLALTGNAFFVVDGPQGPLYTRNGAFEMNSQGELQTKGGLTVRGQGGGRLRIPPGTVRINVSQEGTVLADHEEVGRLQLASFANPNVLQRAGTTLFQGPAAATPEPGTFRVEQGYREGSNVQMVNEMVSMIAGMRHYEAAEKAMRALSDAVAHNTQPQG
jgi:flagellar basal-body rod protein FlgF